MDRCNPDANYIENNYKKHKEPTPGGLEPPTFRLTAERANRLRHEDFRRGTFHNVHEIPKGILVRFQSHPNSSGGQEQHNELLTRLKNLYASNLYFYHYYKILYYSC